MSSISRPAQASDRTATPARQRAAWLILTILLLFSIAAPLNQFKVPPIMPVLMDAFQLSIGRIGLLMSLYAVTGLILALPAGLIFQKTGHRVTGLLAGGAMVLGAVLGATSTSIGGLLTSRVIEGIGTSFMAVLAPAIIAMWFTAQRRGTAMGIWSSWVPIGSSIMLIVAPRLAQGSSWRAVWWVGALYATLATVLYLVFVKAPSSERPAANRGAAQAAVSLSSGRVMRNRDLWLLATAFGCFTMAAVAAGTYLPTFLSTARGLPLAQASLLASIPTLITIFSCPAGGLVSDKIGSRKRPFLIGMALLAVILPLVGLSGVGGLLVLLILQGLFAGLVPTNIFSAAVDAVGDERQGGLAMAIIMVGQNAGMLVGPLIFGLLVESAGGWAMAFGSLALICLLGAVAGWLARVK